MDSGNRYYGRIYSPENLNPGTCLRPFRLNMEDPDPIAFSDCVVLGRSEKTKRTKIGRPYAYATRVKGKRSKILVGYREIWVRDDEIASKYEIIVTARNEITSYKI